MQDENLDLAHLPCRQFKEGSWRSFQDDAAVETPLLLDMGNGIHRKLWAFPDRLGDLALGHALLDHCQQGLVPHVEKTGPQDYLVRFSPGAPPDPVPWTRPLPPGEILEGAARFMEMAGRWDATGCFHRAALYEPAARAFTRHVEDIGRHNCLDRLAGWALASGRPLGGQVLFVTARATASLVGKAVRSGYSAMISRSAVTTAGVELARKAGMTLVGFSRENRFSVFTDTNGRIGDES